MCVKNAAEEYTSSDWEEAGDRYMSQGCAVKFKRKGYCHYAIYIGKDQEGRHIVGHYAQSDKGKGVVRVDCLEDVAESSLEIVVYACAECSNAKRCAIVCKLLTLVGTAEYNMLTNNCEHFVRWLIDGSSYSEQAQSVFWEAAVGVACLVQTFFPEPLRLVSAESVKDMFGNAAARHIPTVIDLATSANLRELPQLLTITPQYMKGTDKLEIELERNTCIISVSNQTSVSGEVPCFFFRRLSGLSAGQQISVSAIPKRKAERFKINFQIGSDIAFHFNPRLDTKEVGLNTKLEGQFLYEQKEASSFPFIEREQFVITFLCRDDAFMVEFECF